MPAPTASTMDRFLKLIPTPVLTAITALLTLFALADVVIPDPVPFLDEAVLLGLLTGSWMTLLERRRAGGLVVDADISPAPDPAVAKLGAGRVTKELKRTVKELADVAAALRKAGHAAHGLDGLARLPTEAKAAARELKEAEGYLSRSAHDPYALDRELAGLRRAEARAEVDGDAKKLTRAREAVAALKARRAEVLARRDRRDDLLLSMHRLASQAAALLEDLRAIRDERVTRLVTPDLPDLDPRLALVVEQLREARTAEVEVEQTLSRSAVPPVRAPEEPRQD